MITPADLICLPYTSDLTEAGIACACRSLPHTYDRTGGSPFDRMRRIVVGTSVQLAFRRFLTSQQVPFGVEGAAPFTEPDRLDVSLGRCRCDIKSFLVSYREQVRSLHAEPAQLLDAPALVPLDQYAGDPRSPRDLYVFAFLTGLVAAAPSDVKKAAEARRPLYLVHAMPPPWVRPRAWVPLGPLALKSESEQALSLELGGQNGPGDFITRAVELPPHRRLELDADFHSLAYVHVDVKPGGRLGIHSKSRHETYLVQPGEWGNIWVYGMRIYLAGWITREEFRKRACLVPEGSRVFQYDHTRTKNLAVPVSELQPLGELLERTRLEAASNASGVPFV